MKAGGDGGGSAGLVADGGGGGGANGRPLGGGGSGRAGPTTGPLNGNGPRGGGGGGGPGTPIRAKFSSLIDRRLLVELGLAIATGTRPFDQVAHIAGLFCNLLIELATDPILSSEALSGWVVDGSGGLGTAPLAT